MTKPKTLEQLRAEKERAETQLAQEKHKLNRLENRKKYLEKGERQKRTSWTRTEIVSETRTASMFSMPFPLPTGAVPKRWNIGGRHGRNYATPSLRRKGLMFVSTTEAMSVRAWSFFPPSMRAQPSGQWRRKAYAPRKASSTAGSEQPMPLSGTSRRKSLSCLIGLPKQKRSLPSRRHQTLFLC